MRAAFIRYLILTLALAAWACSDDNQSGTDTSTDLGADADVGNDSTGDVEGGDVQTDEGGDVQTDVIADVPLPECSEVPAQAALTAGQILAELAVCYADAGAECEDGNSVIEHALIDLAKTGDVCTEAEIGELLAADSMVGAEAWLTRLVVEQVRGAQAISRHAFGGPHGLLYAEGDDDLQACVEAVHQGMSDLYVATLSEKSGCLTEDSCDAEAARSAIAAARTEADDDIDEACSRSDLAAITFTLDHLLDLAEQQADCTVASLTTAAGDIDVACGPANEEVTPAESAGQWNAVTLDSEAWGTLCGDGSDFSFWWRLGTEPDKIFIDLQGGGVCLDEADCRNAAENGLMDATDEMENPPQNQWNEDDPDNPFRSWTYVYIPYCNQDVFGGGGNTEVLDDADENDPDNLLGAFEVERYGGSNVKATARYVRDAVWAHLDENSADGYQYDEVQAVYAGTSAGGFGAYFHHPYLLDQIGWRHTVASPRVWLSLSDATTPLEGIFVIKLNSWALRDGVPTYCNIPACATGTGFVERHALRLDADSQFLIVSGQSDVTQYRETFHPSIFVWTNLARSYYCDQQGTRNVHWFFPANPEPYQALIDGEAWDGSNNGHGIGNQFVIGDVTLREWFGEAVADPLSVEDLVEEGDLVELSKHENLLDEPAYEEIEPFDCLE